MTSNNKTSQHLHNFGSNVSPSTRRKRTPNVQSISPKIRMRKRISNSTTGSNNPSLGLLGDSSHPRSSNNALPSSENSDPQSLFASRQMPSVKNLLDDTNFFKLDKMLQNHSNNVNSVMDVDTGNSPLVQALLNHDDVQARLLLQNGADPNLMSTRNGETPLYVAACNGAVEEMELLLRQGADPNKTTRVGETPLYGAAYYGQEYCVDLLLEHGADVNMPNKSNGEAPLYGAATQGNALCVDVLMERGADIYQTTSAGLTPLYGAARRTNGNFIEVLLDEAGSVGGYGKSNRNLSSASNSGHEACVKLLLEKDKIIENELMGAGQTPLVWACKTGSQAWVELLLEKGADPNRIARSGDTPLFTAATNGQEECMYMLLDKQADPNKESGEGETALFAACRSGHESCVSMLLDYKADPNKGSTDGMAPMELSARGSHGGGGDAGNNYNNSSGIGGSLINGGGSDDGEDSFRGIFSASAKSRSLLQINEDKEMDPRERKYSPMKNTRKALSTMDIIGERPSLASMKSSSQRPSLGGSGSGGSGDDSSRLKKPRWLTASFRSKSTRSKRNSKDAADDVLAASRDKQSPLYIAALHGRDGCVELLLARMADPNLGDRETGETPLLAAVRNGHIGCVEALVSAGADCDLTSKDVGPNKLSGDKALMATSLEQEMTPLKMAIEQGNERAVKMILEQGNGVTNWRCFEDPKFTKQLIVNAKPSLVVFLLSNEKMKWEAKQNLMEQCLKHIRDDDRKLLVFLHAGLEDLSRKSTEHDTVFLLMIDFYSYCWWIGTFSYSSFYYGLPEDGEPTFIAICFMLSVTAYFFLREALEIKRSLGKYFFDFWNWVDLTSIGLATTTGALYLLGYKVVGGDHDEATQQRVLYIVTSAAAFICLSFVGFLKSTFLPFSNFVGGVVRIMFDLFPLGIVTIIVLAAFSFMFYLQNFGEEGHDTFEASFYTVFTRFVGEFDEATTPLDIIFGVLSNLILLNVIIAIVSTSWESAVSTSLILLCGHRLELLRQVDAFVPKRRFSKRQWLSSGYDEDYNRFIQKNILSPALNSWNSGMKGKSSNPWNPRVIVWSAGRFMLTVPFRILLLAFPWILGLWTFGLLWPKHIRDRLFGIVPDKKDPKIIKRNRSLLIDDATGAATTKTSGDNTQDMVDAMKGLREDLKTAKGYKSFRGFKGGLADDDQGQNVLLESLENRIGRMENQIKNMNNDIAQRYNKIESILMQLVEEKKEPIPASKASARESRDPMRPPSRASSASSTNKSPTKTATPTRPPARASSAGGPRNPRRGPAREDDSRSPVPIKTSSVRSTRDEGSRSPVPKQTSTISRDSRDSIPPPPPSIGPPSRPNRTASR